MQSPEDWAQLDQADPFPITRRCLWRLVEALTVGYVQK